MKRLLICCLFASLAAAEDTSWQTNLRTYFSSAGTDREDAFETLFQAPKVAIDFAEYAKQQAARQAARESWINADRGRGGQNFSSASAQVGSTSLASLAGAADTFAAALESGGFVQTASGTVATFTAKPLAVYNALAKRDQLPCHQFAVLAREDDACAKEQYFKGLSFNVSMDTSRDTTLASTPEEVLDSLGKVSPIVATGSKIVRLISDPRSVSSWGAKYEIYNERDPRNPAYIAAWKAGLDDKDVQRTAGDLATYVNQALSVFDKPVQSPTADQMEYVSWKTAAQTHIQAAQNLEEAIQVWEKELEAWGNLALVTKNSELTQKLNDSSDALIQAEKKALAATLDKPIISFTYTNSRPLNQPDLSNIKLLISKPFYARKTVANGTPEWMFTFNAGFDLYNNVPTGAKVGHLRDVQAALQLDGPVGNLGTKGSLAFSLGAYYQYQIEKGLIDIGSGSVAPNTSITLPSDAKTLLTPSGGIVILQAKLTLKATDAKTSVPIGVSWSNRTELIKADHVLAGHIGVQFDWNALLPKN